jgi:hypothetical protein
MTLGTRVAAPPRVTASPARRRFPWGVHALLAAGWLALTAAGWTYYRLAPGARLHHPLHPRLKPDGTAGLAYAYVGTALLLGLFAYSLRKRWQVLRRLGLLRNWLAVHIACGILGPALITLHSGFKVQGLIAVGYWAMMCVMVSGFVGFYIYRQIPHITAGHATEAELLRVEVDSLNKELVERFGLGPEDLARLRRASGADRAARLGPLASLAFLLEQDIALAFGLRKLQHTGVRRYGRAEMRRLRGLVRQHVVVERRLAFLRQTEALFGYWHAIHKPFAIVLYLMVGVHIGVAIWLGYAWAW